MVKDQIDFDVALEQYKKRKEENAGKQIDNSTLHAGSPMYYYCRFCCIHTDTLPESHMCSPITICKPCDILYKHGLI
jgi:hypothetical protein